MNIKKQLIAEIEKIEDQLILEQLTAIVKNSSEKITVEFNTKQVKEIENAISEINSGEFYTHEEAMKLIKND